MSLAAEVKELRSGRKSQLSETGVRTCDRIYRVKLDLSAADDADFETMEAFVESSLPVALYDAHPAFPEALCRTVVTEPVPDSLDLWHCALGYSSAPFAAWGDGSGGAPSGTGGGASSPNAAANSHQTPADERPPRIRIRREKYAKILERDAVTGAAVLNKAGDPFDPGYEVKRSRLRYEVTFWRKTADLDWDARSEFCDKLNDAAVTLLGKVHNTGTLLVDDVTLTPTWDKGSGGGLEFFWEVSVVIDYDPAGWRVKPLNAGRRTKEIATVTPLVYRLEAVTDHTGAVTPDPVLLDNFGQQLAVGGTPVYLDFAGYQSASFTDLFA